LRAGAGGYFDVAGANPLHLETVLDDPALRTAKFVNAGGRPCPVIPAAAALIGRSYPPRQALNFSMLLLSAGIVFLFISICDSSLLPGDFEKLFRCCDRARQARRPVPQGGG
jgi:hypothetical protein